jgi:molecular chaperone DnaK
VRKSEAFYTVFDNQEAVEINVFQGENPDARQNIQIGEFKIVGLSHAPAGNPVVVDLALDRDGILRVTAKEKKTGLEQRIVINKAMARFDAGELAEARRRIGNLFGRTPEEEAAGTGGAGDGVGSEVDALLARAEAKLDAAGEEDRNEMIDLIEAIRDARRAGDHERVEEASRDLSDLIFYLET